MPRKKLTEQEQKRRELVREMLKETPVRDGQDLNNIMKEIIAEIVNGSLEGELEDELGYAKYDVQNKETDNSRNGYGEKTLHTSYGEVDVKIPRDRQGEYEPKMVSKHKRYGGTYSGVIWAEYIRQYNQPDNR